MIYEIIVCVVIILIILPFLIEHIIYSIKNKDKIDSK